MDQTKALKMIRQFRNRGQIGKHYHEIRTVLNNIDSLSILEKAGNILRRVSAEEWKPAQLKTVKMAVLSNFTCDSLAHYLRSYCLREGIWPEIFVADYNQWLYQLIDPDSQLYQFNPDLTLCLLDDHVVFDQLPDTWNINDAAHAVEEKKEQIQHLIQVFESSCSGTLVLNTIPLSLLHHQSIIDYKSKAQLSQIWKKFESGLLQFSLDFKQVVTLDLPTCLQEVNTSARGDARLAYFASIRLSDESLAVIAKENVKIARSLLGMTKKCLVLDLDHTLWGGVIGDDGLEGIKLGNDDRGKIYVDFQKKIKQLSRQGVLLTINSKNEEANVREVLQNHPDMKLRESDFVLICANWKPKHENMQTIFSSLNIGSDSLVFLDDNPAEREIVRKYVPSVTVPEMPADPAYYVQTLLSDGWFNSIQLTKEDAQRTEKYKQQAKRESFRVQTASLTEYLHGLKTKVEIFPSDSFCLPRLTQLNMRTNQFNMTTRRFNEAQMEAMHASEHFQLIGFRAQDRFGDHGIIGSVIIEQKKEADGEVWWIRNFVMSCRVFSREIETAVLREILQKAEKHRVKSVFGEYIPTAKNHIVKDFYLKNHFEKVDSSAEGSLFKHNLQSIKEIPAWIELSTLQEV